MDLTMMERVGDREEKMEGSCSTGQSPQWAVVPVEEEEEEEKEEEEKEEEEDSVLHLRKPAFCKISSYCNLLTIT
jgi:hypothetical protein